MKASETSEIARRPTVEQWAAITRQFDRLCDLPPREQEARLKNARLDSFVAAEVGRLLAASRSNGILDDRGDRRSATVIDEFPSLSPGTKIDQFRIERLIGRGGAGEVYLATRRKNRFSQRVALKLLRADAIKRMAAFDAERALVAGLDHPGIARLIDGGTSSDGRPYMALDFVEGEPITSWCRSNNASLEKRLHLFLEVCDAISYAHARLIVHHDIKPGNILIDRLAHAKLLDFGIAKVIEDEAQSRPHAAVWNMLTPGYAAPEQLAGVATTTATDIYSLGALLFELLVGRMPWKSSQEFIPTILRRMGDDLPTPPSRADMDGKERPVDRRRLVGDLDAIVTKAMQEHPEDRYTTASELADEIRRYLRNDPILVRSGSARYRIVRFVQRNRWPLAAGAIAALTLIGGSAEIAWQAHRTAIERDVARDQAARFEAANQALLMMFRDASDGSRLEKTSVEEMLDGTTRRIIDSLPADSPDAAPMIAALADIYLITENNADAQALLSGALNRGIGRYDPVNWARLKLKLGTIFALQGRFAQAIKLLDDADTVWRTDGERYLRERVETVGARAAIARLQDRPLEAIRLLTDDMPAAAKVYAADDRDYAARSTSLALLLADMHRLDDAVAVLQTARQSMARPGQPPSNASLTISRLEADIFNRAGNTASAIDALHRVIAERRRYYGPSIALAVDLLYLARTLNLTNKPAPALAALAEAEPMASEHFGLLSQPVLQIRIAKIDALARLGRIAEAQAVFATIDPVGGRLSDRTINSIRYLRVKALLVGLSGDSAEGRHQLSALRQMALRLGHSADIAILEISAADQLIAGSRSGNR